MKLYTKHVSPGGRTTYDEFPVDEISCSACSKCEWWIKPVGAMLKKENNPDGDGICDKHSRLTRPGWHCFEFEPIVEDE